MGIICRRTRVMISTHFLSIATKRVFADESGCMVLAYRIQRGSSGRFCSTIGTAVPERLRQQEKNQQPAECSSVVDSTTGNSTTVKDVNGILSYWGVPPRKITKEDGIEWRWSCFRVKLLRSLIFNFYLFLGIIVSSYDRI